MAEKFYVVEVTTTSSGGEDRKISPYDDRETALRKFFAPLGNIGGGPTRICVMLLNEYFDVVKREIWEHQEPVVTEPIMSEPIVPESAEPAESESVDNSGESQS